MRMRTGYTHRSCIMHALVHPPYIAVTCAFACVNLTPPTWSTGNIQIGQGTPAKTMHTSGKHALVVGVTGHAIRF